jgi:DNA-binding response OmpR family regulator
MRQRGTNENDGRRMARTPRTPGRGGELHIIGMKAFLRALPVIRTDRERLLSMLRSRPFVTYSDAIEALWGGNEDGGPLYAQHILGIYVSRLRRAGHLIENFHGIGYRIQETSSGRAPG